MRRLLPLLLLSTSCGDMLVEEPSDLPVREPTMVDRPAPPVLRPPFVEEPPRTTPSGLAVEEWGTFTSVQSSTGVSLPGLHHEDEVLPEFVERRNWSDRNNYYLEMLAEEPLQQLETPVLYFWSDEPRDVHVHVEFPEGVVGQWYPRSEEFTPALGEVMELAGGSISWDVRVDPGILPSSFVPVDPGEIWAPSRRVSSTPLSRDGAYEQFIFYRGLGRFEPAVHVTQSAGRIEVANGSDDDLPAVFLLRVRGEQGSFQTLGPLRAGSTLAANVPERLGDDHVEDARAGLKAALLESGLRDDVAQAMVDTWTRSWFGNEGVRVLYIAPRAWADELLPTTIVPAPDTFLRTFVGRIESLAPEEEATLAGAIRRGDPVDVNTLGRFAEPRLRGALDAMADPAARRRAAALVEAAHALP